MSIESGRMALKKRRLTPRFLSFVTRTPIGTGGRVGALADAGEQLPNRAWSAAPVATRELLVQVVKPVPHVRFPDVFGQQEAEFADEVVLLGAVPVLGGVHCAD